MSAPVVEPSACRWCGIARRGHGRQFADAVGWHEWSAPSQEQILARMKARRLAVVVAREGALPMPVAPKPQALPWAHSMSDHDLHGFLDDLVSAAMGRWRSEPEVPDRTVLADIEKVCAAWRTPGAGSRLDGSEFDGVVVRLVEPEPEFHAWLHHENRVSHDLPETGGAS